MFKRNSLLFLVFLLLFQVNNAQFNIKSISPTINQKDVFNSKIIETLGQFLNTKDPKYWLQTDFEKFQSPYYEIIGIEGGKLGNHFYQPSLMEIIPTEENDKKIVKIAFIGYHKKTESNLIKAIYNVIATKKEEQIFFSKYIDYATKSWKTVKEDNITYIISPAKHYNFEEAEKQKKDIHLLSDFFGIEKFPISYYSAISSEEVFKLKGFDYHPMMYADQSGGFAENHNVIISGNNSEYYTHEVAHLYTSKLFPKINPFFNEGMATYFGGSGKFDYRWQKEQLKKFLIQNPNFDIFEHSNVYERLYFEKETPVLYVISAVICEMIINTYGKEKLFTFLGNNTELKEAAKVLNLNQNNMNLRLLQFLK